MNPILLDFETHIEATPPEAAKFLGVAYSTYAQYRSELRRLQTYHQHSIETVKLLTPDALEKLKSVRLNERKEARRGLGRSQPGNDI